MDAKQTGVWVRLLIFSGRPDPEWQLEAGAADRIGALLRDGRALERIAPPQPRLGYRGFLVRNPARAAQLPAELQVFGGVIVENPGKRESYRADTGGLEEYLLREAVRQGHGEVLAAMGGPGSPPPPDDRDAGSPAAPA